MPNIFNRSKYEQIKAEVEAALNANHAANDDWRFYKESFLKEVIIFKKNFQYFNKPFAEIHDDIDRLTRADAENSIDFFQEEFAKTLKKLNNEPTANHQLQQLFQSLLDFKISEQARNKTSAVYREVGACFSVLESFAKKFIKNIPVEQSTSGFTDRLTNLSIFTVDTKFNGLSPEQFRNKLDDLRRQRTDWLVEIDEIKHAPLPLVDVLNRVDRFIEANNSVPGLSGFFIPHPVNEKPLSQRVDYDESVPTFVVDGLLTRGKPAQVNMSGILCGLFPEQVKKALTEKLTAESEFYEAGAPLQERSGLIQALQAKILNLEIEEEALICAAKIAGISGLYRRDDVNPQLVLTMDAVEDVAA